MRRGLVTQAPYRYAGALSSFQRPIQRRLRRCYRALAPLRGLPRVQNATLSYSACKTGGICHAGQTCSHVIRLVASTVVRMRIVARALRKEGSWSTPTTGPRGPSEALTASAALAHAAESPSHDREAAPDAPVTAGPAAPASRGRWFLDRAEGASSAATSSATAASALRVRDAGSARAGRMRA